MARDKEKEKVVEEDKVNPYYWVHDDVRTRSSSFVSIDSMGELRGLNVVKEGSGVVVEFLPYSSEDKVCEKRGDWQYFYFYTPCLIELHVSERGSKRVMVRSVESEYPFYLDDELIERFPLYWYSEPCRILEAVDRSEEEERLIDFLVESFARGECLSIPDLLRYHDSGDMEDLKTYLGVGDVTQSIAQPASSFKRKRNDVEKTVEVISEGNREVVGGGGFAFDWQKKLHGFIPGSGSHSLWSDQFDFADLSDKVSQYPGDMLMTRRVGIEALGKYIVASRLMCVGRTTELIGAEQQEAVNNVADFEKSYNARITEMEKAAKEKDDVVAKAKEFEEEVAIRFGCCRLRLRRMILLRIAVLAPEFNSDQLDMTKIVVGGKLVVDGTVEEHDENAPPLSLFLFILDMY
ncbi:uncharacterized protein DS421_9g279700 [Arachis hypogaea]|nr:uncharacterized protein DS421_9g279700 [Arachis hypogaea]